MSHLCTEILAIDDEPLNLALISDILELSDEDYHITSVDRGGKGLKLLQQQPNKFSIILLDLMMPEMTGMEFYKEVQNLSGLNGLIVIVQTARAGQESLEEVRQAGISYCITKPFLHDEFCYLIHSARNKVNLYRQLITDLKTAEPLPSTENHLFKLRSKQDVFDTTLKLAQLVPADSAEKMLLVFWEALYNTFEHGLLKLGYENKNTLLKSQQYDQSIKQAIAQLPDDDACYIVVSHIIDSKSQNRTKIIFTAQSSSRTEFFNYEQYKTMKTDHFLEPNGRGIATIHKILKELFPHYHCDYSNDTRSLTLIF